jgi:integrase
MARLPWEITREMFLSDEEVKLLLSHVSNRVARKTSLREKDSAELDRVIIFSLLYSGLRTSEFCRLKVADTVVGLSESVFQVQSHGKDSCRRVYVPTGLSEIVRHFIADVRPRFLPEDLSPNDLSRPLAFSEHRQPYQRTGLYRRVKRILTAAGLGERANVQLLRHTYGCLAYKNTGGNLLFLQRQLGHAHPMITSVYAQLVDESYESLAECVPGEELKQLYNTKEKKHAGVRIDS